MRVTLSVLFMGFLLAIPAVVLLGAAFEREALGETAAERVGTPFAWPERPQAADPVVALRILADAATATGSTVLRTTTATTATTAEANAERKHITHYVLIGGDRTALFDEFVLAQGRWLNPDESRDGVATVSSVADADRVGVPAVFGNRYELTFAPLHRAFESLPSSGRYVVESPDRAATDRFLAVVRQRLAEAGAAGADLTANAGQVPVESGASLEILAYVLAALATVVIAVVLLREGKRIGVLRLAGHSAARIWYDVVGRLQLAAILAGLGACVAVVLAVPGADSLFLSTLTATFLQVTVIGLAATLGAGLVVVHRVRVPELVKGGLQ